MFLDEKELTVQAGKGGDGAALFRREIYVPRGGPDGGDGGRGGDVVIVGKGNVHALAHLAHIEKVAAQDGQKGGHQRSTGKSGEHTDIAVPLGTVIEEQQEDGSWQEVGEINEEGQQLRIAKGGNGGWGNWRFRSSIQQAPDRYNPGLPGDRKHIRLILKLIADVGLVGFPNAGKSTLLSVVSAAKPKIANYPFTTLEPQLGVAMIGTTTDNRQIVIADLPGLIEGASEGKGLGVTFLKHIERTRTIVHCISSEQSIEEMKAGYATIRHELENWSSQLATKPEIIAITKSDLVQPAQLVEMVDVMKKATGRKVFAISAATHTGLTDLLTAC